MTVGRTEALLAPEVQTAPQKPEDLQPRRLKSGAGSYEDPADRQKKRPEKPTAMGEQIKL